MKRRHLSRSKWVTASVRAQTKCLVLMLEREAFEQRMASRPALRRELGRLGAERLGRTALLLANRP